MYCASGVAPKSVREIASSPRGDGGLLAGRAAGAADASADRKAMAEMSVVFMLLMLEIGF